MQRVLKRLVDIAGAGAGLLLLAPILAAIALLVVVDSGLPVLFPWRVVGRGGRYFTGYKFRTMVPNAEALQSGLAGRNEMSGPVFKMQADPRVTRVGRVLRRYSLDELPQLFNVVFRGNLSLVGPRPHAVQAKASNRLYDEVVDGYFARHRVKPGITGWAQVNGWRGETDTEDKIQHRVEHDLYYIENWSVLLDLRILAMTPFKLLSSESAY